MTALVPIACVDQLAAAIHADPARAAEELRTAWRERLPNYNWGPASREATAAQVFGWLGAVAQALAEQRTPDLDQPQLDLEDAP
jgi:hypothetical protein